MSKFVSQMLVISFSLIHPLSASELIGPIDRSESRIEFIAGQVCKAGSFDPADARAFLLQLKREVKEEYGIDINLFDAVDGAMDILRRNRSFSSDQIETIQSFFALITNSKLQEANGWKFWKKKKEKLRGKTDQKVVMSKMQTEFVLPDDMALGFVLVLGGSLLCVVPLGITQNIGAGLITGGIAIIGGAAAKGDKPYYIDSETKKRIPSNNLETSSGLGIGTGF